MSTQEPTICFVIPYFGRWPFWMPFFLASCQANPTVDWLLFSDCGELQELPPNVRIVQTSYEAYCVRVSVCLGIDFHPRNPYKLCDLKPALGVIHEQELAGYEFWGFCDLDLVFGGLRDYYTADRLARKDVFSTHARRISGHCCLLRNTAEIRGLFQRVPNWRERLSDDVHHAFDEGPFSRLFIPHKNWPVFLWPLASWFRRAEFIEAFSTPGAKIGWVDASRDFPSCWFWHKGRLTNDRDGQRHFPYFHFVVWKKNDWRDLPQLSPHYLQELAATERWVIDSRGFHPLDA